MPSLPLPMAHPRKCTTEFVHNHKARLGVFQRRSHCLLKKASELSILCDVEVAVLIFADHLPDRPLVFPPDSDESLRIVKKLKRNPRSVPTAKLKHDKGLNNSLFCDDITSMNVDELKSLVGILDAKEAEVLKKIDAIKQRKNKRAVDEASDPNRFVLSGDHQQCNLFSHQPQVIGNNNGFLNQVSGHVNNVCNDEITRFNVGEAGIEEISDPNHFFFNGDDRQSAMFDHLQDGFPWPISSSVMGENNTPESESENSTEEFSHYDDLMSLDLGELDLDEIMEALKEDLIDTGGEKSNQMPYCWNFPESCSDEFSDPNCYFFDGDGRPTPRVSEYAKAFDFQPHDSQTGAASSSSGAMLIPSSDEVEEEMVNSWFVDDKDGSNIINQKHPMEATAGLCFSESRDCESLASIFYDESAGTNCLVSIFS